MQTLMNKYLQILNAETYLDVDFTLEEIEQLSDLSFLRVMKLGMTIPESFDASQNILDCFEQIKQSNQLEVLRVLEFCELKNAVLKKPIHTVFALYLGGAYVYSRQ